MSQINGGEARHIVINEVTVKRVTQIRNTSEETNARTATKLAPEMHQHVKLKFLTESQGYQRCMYISLEINAGTESKFA